AGFVLGMENIMRSEFLRFWTGLAGTLLLTLSLCGCGPIRYARSLEAARAATQQARAQRAWQWACFEYISAKAYLRKAKEEAGTARYESAAKLADQALKYAQSAQKRTVQHRTLKTKLPFTCKVEPKMEAQYHKKDRAPNSNTLRQRVVE
ncbi:MAG: hypothetical protein AAGJ35_04350, partial [Myxococcota bacterium]